MALFLHVSTLLVALTAAADPTSVTTTHGPIQGSMVGSIAQFLSVPYAKPPVGDLRWTMPQAPTPWTSPLQCTTEPPACTQGGRDHSEDCLYLNVFAPSKCSSSSKCATMLWIHGGSYLEGSANAKEFNGTLLAQQDVIIIAINYRLGVLGFLWNPELDLYGNFGHVDQAFAIEWAYDNVEAFGGDKNRIFLFGESAGATSVSLHVMNTTTTRRIAGAIAESIPSGIPLRNNQSWGLMPTQFEDVMGCSRRNYPDGAQRLACLRADKATDRLLIAQDEALAVSTIRYPYLFWPDFMPWTPTVDPNGLIKKQPVYAFMEGDTLDIPFISGTNENESNIFWDPIPTECFEVSVELDDLFGPKKGALVREKYNIPTGFGDCRNVSKAFQTDSIFRCGSRNMTAAHSKFHTSKSTYWYHFDHTPSWGNDKHCSAPDGGPCHGAEVSFVFGTIPEKATAAEQELSDMMRLYWTSFARGSGDVNVYAKSGNNKLFKEWAPYAYAKGKSAEGTMLLDTNALQVDSPYEDDIEYCDWWDREIGYDWLNRGIWR